MRYNVQCAPAVFAGSYTEPYKLVLSTTTIVMTLNCCLYAHTHCSTLIELLTTTTDLAE
jgi:hypothetical protein